MKEINAILNQSTVRGLHILQLEEERNVLIKALQGMLKEFNESTINGMVHDEFMACVNARDALASVGVTIGTMEEGWHV